MLSPYSALISAVPSFTCNRPTCLAWHDSVAYRANLGCLVTARFSDCSKQYAGLESWATKLPRIETVAIRLRKHANHFSTKLGTCVTNAGDCYAEEAVILRNSPDRTVGVLEFSASSLLWYSHATEYSPSERFYQEKLAHDSQWRIQNFRKEVRSPTQN